MARLMPHSAKAKPRLGASKTAMPGALSRLSWSVLWLILVVAVDAEAQPPTEVTGVVWVDGRPVVGALVILTCGTSQAVAVTDANGDYRFATRPPGDCTVAVKIDGVSHEPRPLPTAENELSFALASRRRLGSTPIPFTQEPLSLYSTEVLGTPARRPGRFQWHGNVSGRALGDDSPYGPANARSWRLTTGLSYVGKDASFGVSLEGHHGVHLPSYMTDGIGDAFASGLRQPSFADVTGSPAWDARLVMKRRVFGSGQGVSADAIVEALVPLDRELLPGVPDSFTPLRSRSLRFGIVISY